MLVRRGVGRLLQAYKTVAEPCFSQPSPNTCGALDLRAGLHCLAGVPADPVLGTSSGRQSGRDQRSGQCHTSPWNLPHQARLASTTPGAASDAEVLEGSEPPSDVQPPAGSDSFSPEATAQGSAPASSGFSPEATATVSAPAGNGVADSSLDASSVLDAAGMAESDALACALEGVWPLNAGMQSVLLGIHSVTGLPW